MKRKKIFSEKKVALVTGGAHGIGRAIAEVLAGAGIIVVVVDIQKELGESVAAGIFRLGGKAKFIYADLRKESDIKRLINSVIKKFGRLDIIVNNARPRLKPAAFKDSFKEWELAMDVLLKAPGLIIKYALPHLIKAKNSSIINISSTNAYFVSQQPVTYHLAKAGLIQLTKYIAFQFGADGVRANVVCPGLVDLIDVQKPLTSDTANKAVVELTVPLGRAAAPNEIASVVLSLCTAASSYITGQVVNVDGGLTLGEHFYVARKAYLKGKKGK